MSSAPVVPTPAPKPVAAVPGVIATVEKDITWIRTHVILALCTVALLAGIIIGGIALFEHLIELHDERVAAAQLQKEGVDTATTAALMSQLAQEHADHVQRDAEQAVIIQSLLTQMKQEHAATNKQVATDATLGAREAADRLVTQTKSSPSDVTVLNDAVTMSLPMTRNVVADLDLFAQAQRDVTNLNGQLTAQTILTSDAKVELSTANQIITADKVELIATIKADNASCKVEVDKEAAKGRKRGFFAAIVGILGGVVLRGAL